MDAIPTFLLRARHWQLFTLLIGLTCVRASIESGTPISLSALLAAIVCSAFVPCWCWSVGSFLNSRVRHDLRGSLSFFRRAVVFPVVNLAVFEIARGRIRPSYVAALLPFHLFALICVIFEIDFVCMNLVLAETQTRVRFRDYAGSFFLLLVFPVGIWFLQPRINRLYGSASSPPVADTPIFSS